MSAADRPNIVVYIAHDTGCFISPYGIATVQTPNAERLAREGAVFENCFCAAPQCSPARAALFTGRYPHSNGVMGLTQGKFAWNLNEGEVHAAQRFKDLGYATGVLGTTHETYNDHETHTKIGFEFDAGWPFPLEKLSSTLSEFLDGISGDGRAFYVQIGTAVNHRPFDHDGAKPDDSLGVTVVPPYLEETPGTHADFAALQGSVKRWDEGLGDLLKVLDERNLTNNTILVVTTDHGIPMPRAKCNLYDLGIEVMLLMRWGAGPIRAGARYDQLISHVDVLPTLLDAVGSEIDESIQGQSFFPLLSGGSYTPRDMIFAELTYHTYYDPMRCVRTPRYKYIRNFEMGPGLHLGGGIPKLPTYVDNVDRYYKPSSHPYEELYDLRSDPDEMNNLAAEPASAEIRGRLLRALGDWMRRTGDPLLTGPIPSPFYHKSISDLISDSFY